MITQQQSTQLNLAGGPVRPAVMGNPHQIAQVMTLLIMVGLVLGTASPALAQAGSGVGAAFEQIVTAITDIIQSVCVAGGILGLSIWGIGKVVRPVFPQLAGLTQNYIGDLMIGIAVVFVAAQVVEGLAGALGGA